MPNARFDSAAKITGRTSNGYTIGSLDAVTNRETARYIASAGSTTTEQAVEPLSVFVAWTQQRFGSDGFGDFDCNRDRAALLHDKADNVFVAKMNYWIGR